MDSDVIGVEQVYHEIDLDENRGQFAGVSPEDYSNIMLREATIENPMQGKANEVGNDPLDINHVVNDDTYRVCLNWCNLPGGVVNPGATGDRNTVEESYRPTDRIHNGNQDNSELVELTSPFVWSSFTNWCGIRYLPPIGAKCIVGFGTGHKMYILGYMNERPKEPRPILSPGEMVIKGYGNNYVHFRQSNKLDLVASASEGEQDYDDSSGSMSAASDGMCTISLNADRGYISIMVNGTGIHITEDGIVMSVNGECSMTLGEGNIDLNCPNTMTRNCATISDNAASKNSNSS